MQCFILTVCQPSIPSLTPSHLPGRSLPWRRAIILYPPSVQALKMFFHNRRRRFSSGAHCSFARDLDSMPSFPSSDAAAAPASPPLGYVGFRLLAPRPRESVTPGPLRRQRGARALATLGPVAVLALVLMGWSSRRPRSPSVERGGDRAIVNGRWVAAALSSPPRGRDARERDPSFRPFARRAPAGAMMGGDVGGDDVGAFPGIHSSLASTRAAIGGTRIDPRDEALSLTSRDRAVLNDADEGAFEAKEGDGRRAAQLGVRPARADAPRRLSRHHRNGAGHHRDHHRDAHGSLARHRQGSSASFSLSAPRLGAGDDATGMRNLAATRRQLSHVVEHYDRLTSRPNGEGGTEAMVSCVAFRPDGVVDRLEGVDCAERDTTPPEGASGDGAVSVVDRVHVMLGGRGEGILDVRRGSTVSVPDTDLRRAALALLELISERYPELGECVRSAAAVGWVAPLGGERFVLATSSVSKIPRSAWRFLLRLVMREPWPPSPPKGGTDVEGLTAVDAAMAMAALWPGMFAPCKAAEPGSGGGWGTLASHAGNRSGGVGWGDVSGEGRPRVGFFLQMAHEPKASLELVKSVRRHFPDAPIMVVSDAGWDCAQMCEALNCRFRRENISAGMHGKGGVLEWIARIREAAEWIDARWLVVLEDDVRVDGPITRWPSFDAGGVEDFRWTAPLKPALVKELTRRVGAPPSYNHYGLCGGAVMRTAALRDTPTLPASEITRLAAMDDRVGKWNDVTLATLFLAAGHTVEPWEDLKQGSHPAHRTAFTHNDKRWYGKPLIGSEKEMCVPPPSR